MKGSQAHASAAEADVVTIYVSMELSRSRWLVGLYDRLSDRLSRHVLAGGDVEGLLALVARRRRAVGKQAGGAVRAVSCYEAGRDGFWLHRRLVAGGIENLVIDPASVEVSRRGRRAKSDRLDLEKLWRVVMAHDRGERVCSVVRVPDVAVEDARRPVRERGRLVSERTAHINRMKGLLFAQGIRDFDPRRRAWRADLAALRLGDGQELPAHLLAELEREGDRLELVQRQLAELEAVQASEERAASEAMTAGPAIAAAQHLQRLNSIGPMLARLLSREVMWRQFQNRRQLAGFVGLAASPFRSGATAHEQGISKAGPPRLRAALIEQAWLWLRHQPHSALSLWFRRRTEGAGPRLRRIMIVALARKLLVALWRYLETGLVPEGATLKQGAPKTATAA